MSINFSFTINNVKKTKSVGDIPDVIINAEYTAKAWSGNKKNDSLGETYGYEYESDVTSTIEFNTSELDSSTFVPFEQITKSVILNWIVDIENISTIENHRDLVYVIDQVRKQIYEAKSISTENISGDNFSQSTNDITWTPPSKSESSVTEEPEEDPNEGITDPLEDTADVPN
jgi:hypothetical protein